MRHVLKTASAEADIRSIALWISQDSVSAAIKWIDDLDREFLKIAQTPGIGTDRRDLRPRLRSVPFGNYLVFFKSIRTNVMILRVIHGARDYSRILRQE